MQERFVASTEATAIVLKSVRRYWRVTESWVALYVWRYPSVDISPGRGPSIVKTLSRDLLEFRRRRRLIVDRMRVRTPGNGKGQGKHCKGKPFFHIMSLVVVFDVPPILGRDARKC
jgi:hypothetical protein